jgi:hypothetical protein
MPTDAGLAQLVVHLICNQGVTGSNPVAGTKIYINHAFIIRMFKTSTALART